MNEAFGTLDLLRRLVAAEVERDGRTASTMVRAGLLLDIIDTRAELLSEGADALDTMVKLRADLAEADAGRHAQRIAVLDLSTVSLRAAIARARGAAQ